MRVPHARCAGTSNVFKIAARYMDLYEHRRNVCGLRSHATLLHSTHVPQISNFDIKKSRQLKITSPLHDHGRQ